MPRRRTVVGVVVVFSILALTSSCAAYKPPDLPPEHPANPAATPAPLPAPSETLSLEGSRQAKTAVPEPKESRQ
jgi:hypothetical protein